VGVSPVLAANIAVNGSFENPDIATNTYDGVAVPGWVGVTFIFDGNGGASQPYPEAGSLGQQYADLGNKPSRLASYDFIVPAGQGINAISWDATTSGGVDQTPYIVNLRDGLGNLLRPGNFIALGGQTSIAGQPQGDVWDTALLPMTAYEFGPGSYRLEFFADQINGSDLFADNVVIDVGQAPEVPEPTSLILLLGGSLLAIKRRRA
jgi:hypothetical protein